MRSAELKQLTELAITLLLLIRISYDITAISLVCKAVNHLTWTTWPKGCPSAMKLSVSLQSVSLIKYMKDKSKKIFDSSLLKCEYVLVSSLLCDSQLNIFELWTKREDHLRTIPGHLGKHWSTFFWHIIDQTTNRLIEKIFNRLIDYENNQKSLIFTYKCISLEPLDKSLPLYSS